MEHNAKMTVLEKQVDRLMWLCQKDRSCISCSEGRLNVEKDLPNVPGFKAFQWNTQRILIIVRNAIKWPKYSRNVESLIKRFLYLELPLSCTSLKYWVAPVILKRFMVEYNKVMDGILVDLFNPPT